MDLHHPGTGVIFDIQRYSIHDGPGIRTVVFFKGCPLRCLWCANPESQHGLPELSYSRPQCVLCQDCVKRCPRGAIAPGEEGMVVDRSRCDLCGSCWLSCRHDGWQLIGQRVTVPEVLATAVRDRVFYNRSGGGITLSGGEPLTQPEFCTAFLASCRSAGLHTALETCGYQNWENLEPILSLVDLVLYDIKVLNASLHRQFTGKPNDLILANAARIAALNKPMIIRVPIIPNHNDSPSDIQETAAWVKEIGVSELHLLPYHRLGEVKYTRLGRNYSLKDLAPPAAGVMEKLALTASRAGISVHVGG